MSKIAVIGAGPAGLTAAYNAAANGADVTVFEKNNKTGKKLRITGKGRCNVTNNCTLEEFMREVPENSKFLYSSLSRFLPADTVDFFESLGVKLKTERGRRVFPVSDNAHDIADALEKAARDMRVKIRLSSKVTSVTVENGCVKGLTADGRFFGCDAVIVASGGASYPLTGSTGDGYAIARKFGIEVNDPVPSLVPIVTEENVYDLSGLSLKNVTVTVTDKNNNTVFSEMGEMLFTHFGMSGPLILSASSHMRGTAEDYCIHIDLKPALDESTLDARILSDFSKYSAKDFINSLSDLLPKSLIPYIVKVSKIPPHKKTAEITKEERHALLSCLKYLTFSVRCFRPISEAIVTRGGVSVSELKPSTMQAKKVEGLYFCGEVIDVDAYTGGYNLQIAFSTGTAAGSAAAQYVLSK